MIGYFILVHHRADAVRELIEAIHHPHDAFVLSIDGASPPEFKQSFLALQAYDNIRIVETVGVSWGGVSILDAMLEGIKLLCEQFPAVEYVVFLSGECFPVKPRARLIAYLKARPGMSFVHGNRIDEDLDDATPAPLLASPAFSPARTVVVNPSGGLGINVMNRPRETARRGATGFVLDPWHSYVHTPAGRVFCFNHDMPAAGLYVAQAPREYFLAARRHFAKKYSRYWQDAWCVLTREFCEFALSDERAFSIYDHLRNSRIPDESFFLTLIENSPFAARRINHRLTFDDPAKARVIDEGDIAAIDAGDYFFARKFTAASQAAKRIFRDRLAPPPLPSPPPPVGERPPADMIELLATTFSRPWRWGERFSAPVATVSLEADGTLRSAPPIAQSAWKLAGGALRLSAPADGAVLAFTSYAFGADANAYLFAASPLRPHVVHYLEAPIASLFGAAVGLAEAVRWLVQQGRVRGAGPPFATVALVQATIDGRVMATGAGEPGFRLTPAGALAANALGLEYVLLVDGELQASRSRLLLLGVARSFAGKTCACRFDVRLST